MGRGSVFVELQHNRVHGDTQRIPRAGRLAEAHRCADRATGNVHYHLPPRHRLAGRAGCHPPSHDRTTIPLVPASPPKRRVLSPLRSGNGRALRRMAVDAYDNRGESPSDAVGSTWPNTSPIPPPTSRRQNGRSRILLRRNLYTTTVLTYTYSTNEQNSPARTRRARAARRGAVRSSPNTGWPILLAQTAICSILARRSRWRYATPESTYDRPTCPRARAGFVGQLDRLLSDCLSHVDTDRAQALLRRFLNDDSIRSPISISIFPGNPGTADRAGL